MSARAVLVLALLVPLSGCEDSTSPLSDPGASKPDGRLAGAWRLNGEDGQVTYYHIGRTEEKLPPGVMRAVGVTHKSGMVEPPAETLLFATTLQGKTYLNVTEGKEAQVKRIAEKGWQAVDSYYVVKYQVDGDKLLLWFMDGDAKKRAIQDGKIKGVVEKNKAPKFTDTTENLVRLVTEAGESLYPNEPVRLERIEGAKGR